MKRLLHPVVAMMTLLLPGAVFANVTGSPTVNSGQTLSLETGTSSGTQDILFTGTGISFQGSAKGANLTALSGLSGSSSFTSLTSAGATAFSGFSSLFSSASITPLTAGAIIAYKTNAGNTGALLLNTVSTSSISIQFVTFESGTGGGSGGPSISAVLNNYGLVPTGFTNSSIAPGTLFIIKGSGLSTITTAVLQNPAAPGLPSTLGGTTVSVTVNGTTTHPAFYYAEAVQLALVLPSNTPAGTGTVTVTVNGQSAQAPITVVASNFGMLSADQTGSGTVKAVNPNNAANPYISFTNSAPPGQIISIYGSGLGADPTRDVQFVQPTGAQINGLSAFYVGGMQVQIQYQGASGYPGLNQVNIVLPSNVPTGCFVSIVGVTAAGVPTNFLTLPIGSGVCQDAGLGYSGSTLTSLSGQTNVRSGFVGIGYSSSPNITGGGTQVTASAFASFSQYTGSTYGTSTDSVVSIGGCIVSESLGTTAATLGTTTPLNAGTITVTSPNAGISPVQLMGNSFVAGVYEAELPSGFLTQAGGTFPISATAGTTAPAVGAFSTQVAFPTPLLTWTNQAADGTVVRSSGVTVTWSSGSPGTYVEISGVSIGASTYGFFSCLAPVAAGTFTVPPYVLATLPASLSGAPGSLSVGNYTGLQTFTASGLDVGFAEGYVNYTINAVYQ